MNAKKEGRPNDIIPQKEAAEKIGKSLATIRNWRKKGALETYTEPGSRSAMVSLSQLMQVAGLQAQGHSNAPVQRSGPLSSILKGDSEVVSAMKAHLSSLESQITDLQRQRDSLQRETEALTQENRDLRRKFEEATAANGGIRGFFGRLRR